jgi:cytoskeletal protein CcmA (bactofilin family)
MLKRNTPVATGKVDTLIGAGTTLEGKVQGTGILRVEGRIRGEVVSDGDIIVGEKGEIRANIKARNVSIAGRVNGNIHASGRMHLMASASLQGDIDAGTIIIEEGAQFKGACRMVEAPPSGKHRSAEPEPPREPDISASTTSTVTFNNITPTEKRDSIRSMNNTPLW